MSNNHYLTSEEMQQTIEALEEAVYWLHPTEQDMQEKGGIYRIVIALEMLKEKNMNASKLAQARRLHHHVLNGGTLTPDDVSFMVVALEEAYQREEHMKDYRLAKVKFNNGYGALLCNECSTIIAEGWEHEDRAHLCEECKESNDEDN